MGLSGIDLLASDDWPIVRQEGLVCSMGYAALRDDFIPRGFNDPANHDLLVGELERALPLAAQHGVPNLIAMFGNRQGTQRCASDGTRASPDCAASPRRRAPWRDDLRGAAQQQSGSQGLSGRSHRVRANIIETVGRRA